VRVTLRVRHFLARIIVGARSDDRLADISQPEITAIGTIYEGSSFLFKTEGAISTTFDEDG
jgi:hypothetical protein